MDRYQRVEKPRPEAAAISENEIRITTQGLIRNYVTYATSLLQEKRVKEIVLKAMGQAISKTVAIAEIIKKRIPGLHQDTVISSISITDVWEPIEEGLVPLEMTRHVSMISISLSPKELNKNSPGSTAFRTNQAPKISAASTISTTPAKTKSRPNSFILKNHMAVAAVEAGGEDGAGVAGVDMVEGMVDMITKEGTVGMDTKVDTDIKVAMATREDMATTKVVMGVMVMIKVDTEDMKMAGTTTETEAAVVAEEEATGVTVVLGMSVVAEVEVPLASGAMREAADEWVVAVGGATKTIRP
ncbi:hypothetical protein EJB05_07914 [Eragrostis curvula]|uniref:DNA/RNA-binding protein Alba-like domain-containing protein n=1 Tax=Eragrostis curvula TaxID=38414 RepID=A0A5J9WLX3_9POAL|nr:hypothetical protein EJB05_07914 [Eragrostis curvula]